jgi:protein phosphatase PTC7
VPLSHFPLLLTHLTNLLSLPANAHLDAPDRSAELARLYADILVAYGRAAMTRTGAELDDIDGQLVKSWKTPFELEAKAQGLRYEGGKVDE